MPVERKPRGTVFAARHRRVRGVFPRPARDVPSPVVLRVRPSDGGDDGDAGDRPRGGGGVVKLEPRDARDVDEEDGDAAGEHAKRVSPVVLAARLPVSLEAADRLRGNVARGVLQRELAAAIEVIRLLVLGDVRLAVAEDRAQHERTQDHGVEHQRDDDGGGGGVGDDEKLVHVRGFRLGVGELKLDEGDDSEARYERREVGDGLELLGFLLDVAAILLGVSEPNPPCVLQHALFDVLLAPLAVLLAPEVLEVPPVALLDAEVHVLGAPLAILDPPRPLLLAPRAAQGGVERGQERLRTRREGRRVGERGQLGGSGRRETEGRSASDVNAPSRAAHPRIVPNEQRPRVRRGGGRAPAPPRRRARSRRTA